jgi:tetratricopeptide (TPR) repeat protein
MTLLFLSNADSRDAYSAPWIMSERRDPTLGAMPDVNDDSKHPLHAAKRRAPRARWPWLLAVVITVASGFALHHWRNAIGVRLVPAPERTQLMQQAAAALRANRLTSPDGRGARELYQAVLARDPDDFAAREGLVRVGTAALAQARAAVSANRRDDARRELDLARDLAAPVADTQRVENALRSGEDSDVQLLKLLDRAATAESAGHVDDGNASALAIYQQALAAAPDNAVVLARRQALLARMLAGIDALFARDDTAGAQALIDRVATVDPGDLEVVQQQQGARSRSLDAADKDLRAGRVDLAIAGYRKVLVQAPIDLRAHTGLRSAAAVLVRVANHAAANFDFSTAEAALAQAHALSPESPGVRAAEQHLALARVARASIPSAPSAANKATVDDLLAAADHAIVRNELVDPPGDSAFDKLRAASAIAPTDPRVFEATKRFAATAIACYQREMTGNHLVHAEACFDALIAVQPSYTQLPSMRQSLAARWLAVADERLGAGELDNAQRAISSAQRLVPGDPAIPALQARLRQAHAGSHP